MKRLPHTLHIAPLLELEMLIRRPNQRITLRTITYDAAAAAAAAVHKDDEAAIAHSPLGQMLSPAIPTAAAAADQVQHC